MDLQFTNYYLSLDSELRKPNLGVEKFLLRTAFDTTDLLPKNILWRHKEAFRCLFALVISFVRIFKTVFLAMELPLKRNLYS